MRVLRPGLTRAKNRLILLLLLLLPVFGFSGTLLVASSSPVAGASHDPLTYPFDAGQTWQVVQGYNSSGTHSSSGLDQYALDLVRTDCNGCDSGNETIHAVFSGKIVRSVNFSDEGCDVIIAAPDGVKFLYVHLNYYPSYPSCNTVSAGQAVSQGDAIGTVYTGKPGGIDHVHVQWCNTGFAGCSDGGDKRPLVDGVFQFPSPGPTDGCTPANGEWCGHTLSSPATSCSESPNPCFDLDKDGDGDAALLYDYGGGATRIHAFVSTRTAFTYLRDWWSVGHGFDLNQVVGAVGGDFNGDGFGDVAAVYDQGNGSISIFVWTSNGSSFDYQRSWLDLDGYPASGVKFAVPGDFNKDGRTDIALLYDYGGGATRIHVFLSTGTSFTYMRDWWSVGHGFDLNQVVGAVGGDFNGDGFGDVAAVYDQGNGSISIFVWTSNGSSFDYQRSWLDLDGYPASGVKFAVPGDFNKDGRTDIALLYDYGGGATRIHVFLSTGTSFTYMRDWWSVGHGFDLNQVVGAVGGDFNGDGFGDVAAVYDQGNGSISIFVWTSNGSSFDYQRSWLDLDGYPASGVRRAIPGTVPLPAAPTPTPTPTPTLTPTLTPTPTPTPATPSGAVGGIADLPDVASGRVAASTTRQGSSSPPYAAIVGAAAAGLLAFAAGGWYARRRWPH